MNFSTIFTSIGIDLIQIIKIKEDNQWIKVRLMIFLIKNTIHMKKLLMDFFNKAKKITFFPFSIFK